MIRIIGVRFRNAGKVYYFDPKEYKIKPTDHVIVETARGVEYGTVLGHIQEVPEEKVIQPLKPVLRVATAEDDAKVSHNREREKEAMRICKEKIRKHKLDMKLIDAEYTFDNNKVLFYFTADGRIDFRELVKDLAAVFRTRIELRQIGVRDETKILGGVGICGRQLCCNTFLSEFAPVSIRMAKEQNLSLNPTKISGVCGRLMCCLKNEEETYEYLNGKLPGIGDTVTTATGLTGDVTSVSVLRQKVKVLVNVDGEKEIQEYDVNDLKFHPKKKKEKGGDKSGEKSHDKSGEWSHDKNGEKPHDKTGEWSRDKTGEKSHDKSGEWPRDKSGEKGNERSRDRGNDRGRGKPERSARPEKTGKYEKKESSEEWELKQLEALEKREGKSRLEDD